MALEGLHHVTAITGNARANVDFYTGRLGLRLVKKTVNFDAPDVYHLYFGDEVGHPGSVLTFFEFPGATPGRAGEGMVHLLQWRVGSTATLDYWAQRLGSGTVRRPTEDTLRFCDPEGLAHELVAISVPDAPLSARHPDIPAAHALQGFHGVRAYASDPSRSASLLHDALGFRSVDADRVWVLQGEDRHALLSYDPPQQQAARQGAGTVHHVAWCAHDDPELRRYRILAVRAGRHATEVIDRQYFHSVYFREPSGVLFELATRNPGFTVDEPAATLGGALKLPPQYESLRARLERELAPLPGAPAA